MIFLRKCKTFAALCVSELSLYFSFVSYLNKSIFLSRTHACFVCWCIKISSSIIHTPSATAVAPFTKSSWEGFLHALFTFSCVIYCWTNSTWCLPLLFHQNYLQQSYQWPIGTIQLAYLGRQWVRALMLLNFSPLPLFPHIQNGHNSRG